LGCPRLLWRLWRGRVRLSLRRGRWHIFKRIGRSGRLRRLLPGSGLLRRCGLLWWGLLRPNKTSHRDAKTRACQGQANPPAEIHSYMPFHSTQTYRRSFHGSGFSRYSSDAKRLSRYFSVPSGDRTTSEPRYSVKAAHTQVAAHTISRRASVPAFATALRGAVGCGKSCGKRSVGFGFRLLVLG
jgi:hypothetical protein